MKALPAGLQRSGETTIFETSTIPEPLTNWHQTGHDTWAEIVVIQGSVRYEILSSPPETIQLDPDTKGVIEPEVPHRVSLSDDAKMQVVFYKSGG